MTLATTTHAGSHLRGALCRAARHDTPFRYWLTCSTLPRDLARRVAGLDLDAPRIGDTLGKRETHNASRVFLNEDACRAVVDNALVAEAFQDDATVGLLADMTGADLDGAFLRIEYCLDMDGFWLEPHTDIGAKLLTFLIYLSDGPEADDWGTDLMTPEGDVVGRAPGGFGKGLIFVPGTDTWHGFTRRPIHGVRRSLIVNYVKPEWRSRHELAFPTQKVRGV